MESQTRAVGAEDGHNRSCRRRIDMQRGIPKFDFTFLHFICTEYSDILLHMLGEYLLVNLSMKAAQCWEPAKGPSRFVNTQIQSFKLACEQRYYTVYIYV